MKSAHSAKSAIGVAVAAIAACGCGWGCKGDKGPQLGAKVVSSREIAPGATPGSEAVLVLAGTRFPVQVTTKTQDKYFTIELKAHGEALESERYVTTVSEFALFEAALETYRPPLTLLRFPMSIGESWEWSGALTAGDLSHTATATVSTSQGKLNVEGFSDDALTVRVQLRIGGESGQPATRNLAFWFVPGKGILRREFGHSSTRIPSASDEANGS